MRKWISLTILISSLLLPGLASAAPEADLVREVQKRTKALADYQVQRREVLDHLYQIQKTIKSLAKTQAKITAGSQRLKVEMEKATLDLTEMEESLIDLRKRVGKSALLLSHVDASSLMKILFASKSPAELDRTFKFFELLVQRELKVLKAFQLQKQEIKAKQSGIETKLAEIRKSELDLIATEKDLKEEHRRKLVLIGNLDQRRQKEIESLRSLKLKSMRQIAIELDQDQQIREFLRPSFLEQKGRLTPPLSGELLGAYGLITDPELQTETSMGGWFIAARESDTVRAPFAGTVAMIYQDPKLRSVMIIDHGHDYYTSYSNLQTLEADLGDKVEAGQILGQAGFSPRWQSEGVHFEIRHFSEALDPSRWVAAEKPVRKQASLHE